MILHHTRTLDYETCKKAASKFSSRGQFSAGDSVAYRKAMKMGWMPDFFPEKYKRKSTKGLPRKPRRVLDYETCRQSALQATGRKDWDRKDCHAYAKARKMGWIVDFFPEKIVRKSEVTLEKCMEVREMLRAQGKNRVSDFIEYNSNLYNMASRNGWVKLLDFQDRLTSMKEAGLKNRKYSLEYATEVARKYTTLYDFRKKETALYGWCSKNGHLDKFPWLVSQATHYTEEMIRDTISRYTDYTTFYKENNAMYVYMCKNKLLHLADSLERRVQFRDGYALDCIYAYEFTDAGYAYVGRTVDIVTRNREHHNRKDDTVVRFAKENGLTIPEPKIICDNITVKEGQVMEDRIIEQYRSLGWNMINSVKGGSLGGLGYQKKWTLDRMMEVASNYEYLADLEADYPGLAQKIQKRKMMHLFPWLKLKHTTPGVWKNMSEEEAYEYAKTCSSKKEFSIRFKALETWARQRGWTDKWFPNSITRKKRVSVYTLDHKLVSIHESGEAAARALGAKPSCVHHIVKYHPMSHTCKGFMLKYTDDTDNISEEERINMLNRQKKKYRKRKSRSPERRHEEYLKRASKQKLIQKVRYDAKKAAGYRYRKDPATGKYAWVFVGLPEAKEVA